MSLDVNNLEFYNISDEITDKDTARLKKEVIIQLQLSMVAAELEVEYAALHLAELWNNIEDMKINNAKKSSN